MEIKSGGHCYTCEDNSTPRYTNYSRVSYSQCVSRVPLLLVYGILKKTIQISSPQHTPTEI
jgi:hypothetical protein